MNEAKEKQIENENQDNKHIDQLQNLDIIINNKDSKVDSSNSNSNSNSTGKPSTKTVEERLKEDENFKPKNNDILTSMNIKT